MSKCPVHDERPSSLAMIVGWVEDRDALVTFSIDVAERVCDLTSCPKWAREWLATARKQNDYETRIVLDVAREAFQRYWTRQNEETPTGHGGLEGLPRPTKAAEAVFEALKAALSQEGLAGKGLLACLAAEHAQAARAEQDRDAEVAWQAERAEILFCSCPKIPEKAPTDDRTRNSTLSR